jgi:8-oxo-dGTP pyrophosphatase MutT (NUDIX family)
MFREQLRRALELELDYPERGRLKGERPAAVLALWGFPREADPAGPSLLVIKRAETLGSHQGQMAFPGGMCEPGEAPEATALRETHEEVGVAPGDVEVLGRLPTLATVTAFDVAPFVGLLRRPIDEVEIRVDPRETERAIWVPLRALRAPGVYELEMRPYQGVRYPVHAFQVGEHRIWGATGSMLKNLLDRLAAPSAGSP